MAVPGGMLPSPVTELIELTGSFPPPGRHASYEHQNERPPIPSLSTLTARATHARPLRPAALASVISGIVLVRVQSINRPLQAEVVVVADDPG